MRNLSSLALFVLAIGCLAMTSCQNESSSAVKDEARQELEGASANAVTTSNPTSPTTIDAQSAAEAAAAEIIPTGPLTSIEFAETKHEYGAIEQGEKAAHTFTFKNTGNEPLVLSNVKPSCGCTTPSWTKEPIAPGETGSIDVEFDSKGKSGNQTKTVTVTANTEPAKTVLTIAGEVLVPEAKVADPI